jgi:short-subunit dehydrogenase involved in D-alanine esterification of teichoic acids
MIKFYENPNIPHVHTRISGHKLTVKEKVFICTVSKRQTNSYMLIRLKPLKNFVDHYIIKVSTGLCFALRKPVPVYITLKLKEIT